LSEGHAAAVESLILLVLSPSLCLLLKLTLLLIAENLIVFLFRSRSNRRRCLNGALQPLLDLLRVYLMNSVCGIVLPSLSDGM